MSSDEPSPVIVTGLRIHAYPSAYALPNGAARQSPWSSQHLVGRDLENCQVRGPGQGRCFTNEVGLADSGLAFHHDDLTRAAHRRSDQ